MNRSPFFTILTASLNCGATIAATLKSVRDQRYRGVEHIVIDGGSSDETPEILGSYENSYNLEFISEPDHGISDALNKGLSRALGRFVIVLHGDDRFLNDETLKNVHVKLKSEKYDIYSFPVYKHYQAVGKRLYKPIRLLWWHHFKTIFPHQGCFVHKRLFDRIGGFREEFAVALDYDFFYRALHSGASVRFGGMPVALMGGDGISSAPDFLSKRLSEELRVQKLSETSPIWQVAQLLFRVLYIPYKTKRLATFSDRWKTGQHL